LLLLVVIGVDVLLLLLICYIYVALLFVVVGIDYYVDLLRCYVVVVVDVTLLIVVTVTDVTFEFVGGYALFTLLDVPRCCCCWLIPRCYCRCWWCSQRCCWLLLLLLIVIHGYVYGWLIYGDSRYVALTFTFTARCCCWRLLIYTFVHVVVGRCLRYVTIPTLVTFGCWFTLLNVVVVVVRWIWLPDVWIYSLLITVVDSRCCYVTLLLIYITLFVYVVTLRYVRLRYGCCSPFTLRCSHVVPVPGLFDLRCTTTFVVVYVVDLFVTLLLLRCWLFVIYGYVYVWFDYVWFGC